MVSGIGFTELLLLFVIGLLILGPERLPRVASQLGRWVGKARRTANQLRFQMEREIALADIERSQKQKRENRGEPSKDDTPDTAGDAQAPDAAAAEPSSGNGDASPDSTQPADDATVSAAEDTDSGRS